MPSFLFRVVTYPASPQYDAYYRLEIAADPNKPYRRLRSFYFLDECEAAVADLRAGVPLNVVANKVYSK